MYGADCRGLQYMFIHCMGWLRLVGSLKLQVSFAEYYLFYEALLQKRLMILRSLLIVATPYLLSSHKIHYIFRYIMAEYRLFYRAVLQKRPMILGSLLISATPYFLSPHKIQYLFSPQSSQVSFALQVSFAKEPYTRDDILQKRPII